MKLYAIGYSGRDKEKTYEHIRELKEIGVPEPDSVPELYDLNPRLLNKERNIHVIGNETSGEVEIVLIADENGNIDVTVGSDHTDRSLETISIQKSKQICDKPIANETFKLEDVIDEWDDLQLSSEVYEKGEWVKYQLGKVSTMISLDEIKAFLQNKEVELKNVIVFCGTVPLLDGFKYGEAFRCSIHSNKIEKTISLEYKITFLRE